MSKWLWKVIGMLAKFRMLVDWESAWVREAKDPSDLVIALTDRIVFGFADNLKVEMIFHENELGVATAYDDTKHRELEFTSVFVGVDVSAKVMNWDEWFVVQSSDCLRGLQTNVEAAN